MSNWQEKLEELKRQRSTIINQKEKEDIILDIFGPPLSFKKFLETIEGEVHLTDFQLNEVHKILGRGAELGIPEKLFDKAERPLLSVLLYGKGSGKGTVASLIITYLIYMMHYLKPNPASFFGLSPLDKLSIVVVSTNEKQAKDFLERIRNRVRNSKFFSNFPRREHNKIINEGLYNPKLDPYPITASSSVIRFSFINVDVLSVPSRNESFEGLTIIGFVMDEASGHESKKGQPNAQLIFNTLVTSTRNLPYLGLVTSYPRKNKEEDFTYRLYEDIRSGKIINAYASHAYSWVANPAVYRPEEGTFTIYVKEFDLKVDVPLSLKKDFDTDFYSSVAKYLALPVGYAVDRWIPILSQLDDSLFIDYSREPIIKWKTEVVKTYSGYKIMVPLSSIEINRSEVFGYYEYFMGIDAGESDCSSIITIAHGLMQDRRPLLVIDAIIEFKPIRDKNITAPVDLLNFFQVVAYLARIFKIRKVKSDSWNTGAFKDTVPDWDDHPADRDDYNLLKALLMTNPPSIRFPRQKESETALSQLRSLVSTSPTSKPKVVAGYQDIADSLACVAHIFGEMFSIDPATLEVTLSDADAVSKAIEEIGIGSVYVPASLESVNPLSNLTPDIGIGSLIVYKTKLGPRRPNFDF
ncbi:MAG: hypothetical protein ABIM22_07710 [candidate division WOR-3 bacterium]